MEKQHRSVFLLTIPRTATIFFQDLLGPYIGWCGTGQCKAGVAPGGVSSMHITDSGFRCVDDAVSNGVHLLTTWRDPDKVKQSFAKHGDNDFEVYFQAWERLVSEYDPLIVTVEPEYNGISRERRLKALGDKLGLTLETDWVPIVAS